MQLSKNFTLFEMCRSQTATAHGINNQPGITEIFCMQQLCALILQPARDEFGQPIIISSGYRCPKLNTIVGGATSSRHLYGMAADIVCDSPIEYTRLFNIIARNHYVDQLLYERSKKTRWLHVQLSFAPRRIIRDDYIAY